MVTFALRLYLTPNGRPETNPGKSISWATPSLTPGQSVQPVYGELGSAHEHSDRGRSTVATSRFVALVDGGQVVRAGSLQELAQHLYALGIDEHDIHLASPDDGDHAMSLSQHAEFRAAWQSLLPITGKAAKGRS